MYKFKLPMFDMEDDYSGGDGSATTSTEKTFTQSELDRIVKDRLAREREKYGDYDDYKGVVEELNAYGYTGSPKEVREIVKQQREAYQQQQELEDLHQQAEEDGVTPALAKKIKALEDKLEKSTKVIDDLISEKESKVKEAESKAKADAEWTAQVNEFTNDHPDVDLDELAQNQKFIKFIRGKSLPLKELYVDFIEFIGEAEAETIAKVHSKNARSTSSGKASSSDGGSYGLSERQKTLAKNNGMSFKEYSELLKQVN
jgi:hypothetical protein